MATEDKANPILVSNQALYKPQEQTVLVKETTGTVLYANQYSGIGTVAMPDDWKEALNSDYGETGNNIIIQLQQKVQQLPDGPWYVDSRDGVIYIHNRKLQESSVADYTYQYEKGELLTVSFETQYVTRIIRAKNSDGIDPNKGMQTSVIGMNGIKETYLDYYDIDTGNFKPQAIINAFNNGRVTIGTIYAFNERVKETHNNHPAFTKSQWEQINKIHQRDIERWRKAQQEVTDERYKEYQAEVRNNPGNMNYLDKNIEEGLKETFENEDLIVNVREFLTHYYNTDAAQAEAELEMAARNGTLEALLKRRFSKAPYKFLATRPVDDQGRPDGGAVVRVWKETTAKADANGHISRDELDKNPYIRRTGEMNNDGSIPIFTKVPTTVTTTGYYLLHSYYSRKYGSSIDGDLNRRVNAVANKSRKVTEKKLNAKATLIGKPHLKSSQVITIHNVGKKWSGAWYIKSCIHRIQGSGGYTTEVELVKHSGVEGYSSGTLHGKHGRNTSGRNSGGSATGVPISNINLTTFESNYFRTHSRARQEDLLILKMAGVQDAAIPVAGTGTTRGTSNTEYELIRRPTKEERKKYGRRAAASVAGGIKTVKK